MILIHSFIALLVYAVATLVVAIFRDGTIN